MHLWEQQHPYYCNEGNYFSNDCGREFKRFSDFWEEAEGEDLDYNLIFRWDWVEGEDWGAEEFDGDENYRNGILKLFYMGQRKGLYRYVTVQVCRADEPAVIEFLRPRADQMRAIWTPLL